MGEAEEGHPGEGVVTEKYEVLMRQNEELRQRLNDTVDGFHSFKDEKEEEEEKAREAIRNLQAINLKAHSKVKEYATKVEIFQSVKKKVAKTEYGKASELKLALKKAQDEIRELQYQLREKQIRTAEEPVLASHSDRLVKRLKRELIELRANNNVLRRERESAVSRSDSLEKELKGLRTRVDDLVCAEVENERLHQQIQAGRLKFISLCGNMSAIDNTNKAASMIDDNVDLQAMTLSSIYDQTVHLVSQLQQERQTLVKKKAEVQCQNSQLDKKVQDSCAKILLLREKSASLEERLSRTTEQLKSTKRDQQAVKFENETLRKMLASEGNFLPEDASARIQQLQARIGELEAERDRLQSQGASPAVQRTIKAQVDQLMSDTGRLEKENQCLRNEMHTTRLSALHASKTVGSSERPQKLIHFQFNPSQKASAESAVPATFDYQKGYDRLSALSQERLSMFKKVVALLTGFRFTLDFGTKVGSKVRIHVKLLDPTYTKASDQAVLDFLYDKETEQVVLVENEFLATKLNSGLRSLLETSDNYALALNNIICNMRTLQQLEHLGGTERTK